MQTRTGFEIPSLYVYVLVGKGLSLLQKSEMQLDKLGRRLGRKLQQSDRIGINCLLLLAKCKSSLKIASSVF